MILKGGWIGVGRVYKCPVCGFQTEYPIDRGFMTRTEAAVERETVLAGLLWPQGKSGPYRPS